MEINFHRKGSDQEFIFEEEGFFQMPIDNNMLYGTLLQKYYY